MEQKYSLLDMAKLTSGMSLTELGGDRYAIKTNDKIYVKHLNAYYPVIFEKDIIHHLKLLLMQSDINHDERTCLHYLAYELGIDDELEKELFGE